jgi:hypothetical protein
MEAPLMMMRLVVRFLLLPLALLAVPSVAGAASYGAIAYADSTGDFGYSFNYRSAQASTARAIQECKRQSGARDCVMVKGVGTASGDQELCAALTVLSLPGTKTDGEATVFRWRTVETARSRREAEEKSLAACQETRRKLSKSADSLDAPKCELIVGVCSRGLGL